MKKLLIILTIGLSGCVGPKSSFDCPMPDNAVSCKSVSEVSKELHVKKDTRKIIYIKGF